MALGTVDVVVHVAAQFEVESRVVVLLGRLVLGTRGLDVRCRRMQHRIIRLGDLQCAL